MNVPKLTAEDVPLFMGILHDLFPGIEVPVVENVDLRSAIAEEMAANNIQPVEKLIDKIEQFYDTKTIRHGVMIIGSTCSGKSTVWKTLQGSMNRLSKSKPENFVAVRTFPINPKAMSLNSLYGSYNPTTNEWTDGVLSSTMRTVCLDEKKDQKWLVLYVF